MDRYPYTNFHELNLVYFLKHFKEIFQQWDALYQEMQEWKDQAGTDILNWESGVIDDLDVWKAAFEDLFNSTFSDLESIKTSAESARDDAIQAKEDTQAIADVVEQNANNYVRVMTTAEVAAMTTFADMPNSRYAQNVTGARIVELNGGTFPLDISDTARYDIWCWQYSGNYKFFELRRGTVNHYIGITLQDHPTVPSWVDVSIPAIKTRVTNLETAEADHATRIATLESSDASQNTAITAVQSAVTSLQSNESKYMRVMTSAEVAAMTTFADMPNSRYAQNVTGARIVELNGGTFPLSISNTARYDIWCWQYYGSYKFFELRRGTVEHYIGITLQAHPTVPSWVDVSIPALKTRVTDLETASGEHADDIADIVSELATIPGDRQIYKYVAFGSSSTWGAVHELDGTVRKSPYNYPAYVQDILGLTSVNLGVGSTGLIARYPRTGTGAASANNNIMDQIFTHGTDLATAKLITILYSYGNDYGFCRMPVGLYTDYYPYDQEGYHPTGYSGCAEMVNKGATVMGCLNWCIKWLGDHYPYAQLLILSGTGSVNHYRTATITETDGKYSINFVDPYVLPASYDPYVPAPTSLEGSAQIIHELEQLRDALNIPIFINGKGGHGPFSYWQTIAKTNGSTYDLFSTVENTQTHEYEWNGHMNDNGYIEFGKFWSGLITDFFRH